VPAFGVKQDATQNITNAWFKRAAGTLQGQCAGCAAARQDVIDVKVVTPEEFGSGF
jgi:hypothetical protein